MKKLSLEEFFSKISGGESRLKPGVAVSYVLIEEDGEEIFYSEWDYVSEDDDLEKLEKVYQDYINN